MSLFAKILGPRAPTDLSEEDRRKFILPTGLFLAATVLLLLSTMLPYWEMTLQAPQYPKGLHLTAYANRLTGDIAEIDGLNHYIGMRPLAEVAQFEKSVSVFGIGALALLLGAAVYIHNKWVVLLILPAILMPPVFLIDLQWWLWKFGTNLDPAASLSSAIKPFIPSVLGNGTIAQFETVATLGVGLWLAIPASLLIISGLYYHRLAYKPVVDAAASTHYEA